MSQTEIDITSTSRPAAIPRVPKTSNTLPDMFVGARKLLKDTPWMTSMGFGLVMSTLLLCPAVSIWFHDLYVENKEKNRPIQPWYVILSSKPATLEAFRWSILSALFAFAFSMALTASTLAPIATKYSKTPSMKNFGQIVGTLRLNISFFVAALVMAACYLNTSITEVDKNVFVKALHDLWKNPNNMKDPVITYFEAIGTIIMKQQPNFKNIPFILILLSAILLTEKIGILFISLNFHKSFYTKRIRRNNLVLSCFETLSQSYFPPNLKPIKSGSVLKSEAINIYVKTIFDGLLKPGRSALILEDFLEEIDHPIATELFNFLDFNKSDDISLTEFEEAMQEAYDEKKTLLKAIKANEKVIDRIDKFFVSAILLYKLSCFIPKVQLSLFDFIKYIGSSALVLRYLFDHFLEQLFSSVMHFLVTHPYDVGDKILLDEKVYRIKDMGFWKTTLISLDGQVSYLPNHTLLSKAFGNYRRSDRMETNLVMSLGIATSKEDIEMYVAAMNDFIKENGRYLDGHIVIKEVSVPNCDCMVLVFGVNHKFNFNNDDSLHFRCELIFKNMIRIAKEQNLKYYTLRFHGE